MDIVAIEEKIRHIVTKCQNLEEQNLFLRSQVTLLREQLALLEKQKTETTETVKTLIDRLKLFVGTLP